MPETVLLCLTQTLYVELLCQSPQTRQCCHEHDPPQSLLMVDHVNASQAVEEVLETMEPVFEKHPEMVEVMERLVEPERMIAFRVAWVDDDGKQQVSQENKAYS